MSRSLPLREEIKHANNDNFSYSKIAVTSVDNAHVRNFPPEVRNKILTSCFQSPRYVSGDRFAHAFLKGVLSQSAVFDTCFFYLHIRNPKVRSSVEYRSAKKSS